jgi:hypothetical protein
VTVLTDSTTALAWALKGHNSHGHESRSIDRLCDGLRDEIIHMRKLGKVHLEHTSGAINVEADSLSRILDREVDGRKLGELLRLRAKKRKSTPIPAERLVRRTLAPQECLAEMVAGESYDIFHAIETFGNLRRILISWRSGVGRSRTQDPGTNDVVNFEENRIRFCLSAQTTARSLPANNPFVRSASGVIEHHRAKFDGSVEVSAYIPKSSPVTQRSIVRTFHRLSDHRGSRYTVSCIKNFFLEGRNSAVQQVLRGCLRCAVKNAKVQWSLPTSTFPRELNLPAYSRICIDHLHLEKVVALSVMCIDTGVIALVEGNSTTVEHSIGALQVLINRYALCLHRIHCDQASCFTSPKFLAGLAQCGQKPEISFTVPNAPYNNPVERMHAEVRSIIRTSKFKQRCLIDSRGVQLTLDTIANIVNQRPIGVFEDEIITPALLAWGSRWSTQLLPQLRSYFYERCFELLRRTHLRSSQRRGNLVVGARALLSTPQSGKLSTPFSLCRIVDVVGNHILVRTSDGKTRKVGSAQLAPLSVPDHPDFLNPRLTDVSRVGAKVGVVYEDGGAPHEFFGQVVVDHGDQVEILWTPRGDTIWPNELVSWGACRVL